MNFFFLNFSEQQLVDCDRTSGGCNGGWYVTAWDHIKRVGGSARKSSYEYLARVNLDFLFLCSFFIIFFFSIFSIIRLSKFFFTKQINLVVT